MKTEKTLEDKHDEACYHQHSFLFWHYLDYCIVKDHLEGFACGYLGRDKSFDKSTFSLQRSG